MYPFYKYTQMILDSNLVYPQMMYLQVQMISLMMCHNHYCLPQLLFEIVTVCFAI